MEPQTMDQIVIRLAMFSFWRLQTIHSKGDRWYECEIRVDVNGSDYRKVCKATRGSVHDACRAAIAKADEKQKPRLRITP